MDIQKENHPAVEKNAAAVNDTQKHKLWMGTYIILAVICLAVYLLLRLHVFAMPGTYNGTVTKICLAVLSSIAVLFFAKIAELFVARRHDTKAVKYNIVKVVKLLSILIIVFIVITFLNANWYTAAASLGLISLLLGFALQTPISSLIGWAYIVFRVPYKVGDRIQIGDFTGDVVEINYLDTTLWEFAGTYMTCRAAD